MPERVVVAMSGGVDSSVAAALLQEQGFEVVGVTMCFNLKGSFGRRPLCCGLEDIEDARRVAHKLGIRHFVLNMQEALEKYVIRDFCAEYRRGRTPNPCVRCNQYLKFGLLLKKALVLGARYLASGHYARIALRVTRSPGQQATRFMLQKARDRLKDQSYFLYRLRQAQLRHILFPLGGYSKEEVRFLAKRFGLPVAEKLASQEICFIAQDSYRGFLKERLKEGLWPGPILDQQGRCIGRHQGIAFYTIGQRQGLGLAMGYPLYVTAIDCRRNCLIVGRREDALAQRFSVSRLHFVGRRPEKKVVLRVKIRYNHPEVAAEIIPRGHNLEVSLLRPQFAVTCGQAAVFYDNATVVGGGTIDEIYG